MTDTTSEFDGSTIGLEAAEEPAWTAATWFAVLSMAATSFALVSAEFLPAGLLTPLAHDLGRPAMSKAHGWRAQRQRLGNAQSGFLVESRMQQRASSGQT